MLYTHTVHVRHLMPYISLFDTVFFIIDIKLHMLSLSYQIQVGVVITCWNSDTVITLRPRQNEPVLVQVWLGAVQATSQLSLSEPMTVSLLTHIYIIVHSNSERHTKSSIFSFFKEGWVDEVWQPFLNSIQWGPCSPYKLFHMEEHIKLEQYGHSTACWLVWDACNENTVVMMPTLSSLLAPQAVVMTTCAAVNDIRVGIMATLWWD